MSSPALPLALAITAALASPQALAENASQATELDRVVVQGRHDSTPAAPTLAVERDHPARIPGGTNLIDPRTLLGADPGARAAVDLLALHPLRQGERYSQSSAQSRR